MVSILLLTFILNKITTCIFLGLKNKQIMIIKLIKSRIYMKIANFSQLLSVIGINSILRTETINYNSIAIVYIGKKNLTKPHSLFTRHFCQCRVSFNSINKLIA